VTRNRWIALGVVVVLLCAAAAFVATRTNYVNTELAVATGNEFFARLQARGVREALGLGRFNQQGEVWGRLLTNLDAKHGPVTKATLAGVQVVPVERVGCVLLQYQISRGVLASAETLVLCPTAQNTVAFEIVGHELTRLDTQQNIAMGVKVQLSGIRFP
jgi:hypothetical protein